MALLSGRPDRYRPVGRPGPAAPNHPTRCSIGRSCRRRLAATSASLPSRRCSMGRCGQSLVGAGAIPVTPHRRRRRRIEEHRDVRRRFGCAGRWRCGLSLSGRHHTFDRRLKRSARVPPHGDRSGARGNESCARASRHQSRAKHRIQIARHAGLRNAVPCTDLVRQAESDFSGAVRALTDRIATNIRRLLIETDPKRDASTVERIEQIYASARGLEDNPQQRLDRRQAIASA